MKDNIGSAICGIIFLIVYFFIKKNHAKKMSEDSGRSGLCIQEILKALYASGSVFILFVFMKMSFVEECIYLAFPIFLSGIYIIYKNDNEIHSLYLAIKGIYYFFLAIISLLKIKMGIIGLDDVSIWTTISLAIIEGTTALVDGIYNYLSKRKERKQ